VALQVDHAAGLEDDQPRSGFGEGGPERAGTVGGEGGYAENDTAEGLCWRVRQRGRGVNWFDQFWCCRPLGLGVDPQLVEVRPARQTEGSEKET